MTPSLSELWKDFQTPFGKALLAYYLAMATVGLLIPDDVLRSHSWARDLTDWMSGIVPQIDRIAALGIAPDVNRFYFSVLWVTTPVLAVLSISAALSRPMLTKANTIWTLPFLKAVPPVSGLALLGIWGGYGLWYVDPSMNLTYGLFGTRIGRSFGGQIIFFVGPIYAGIGVLLFILGWLTGYIPRNISRIQNG